MHIHLNIGAAVTASAAIAAVFVLFVHHGEPIVVAPEPATVEAPHVVTPLVVEHDAPHVAARRVHVVARRHVERRPASVSHNVLHRAKFPPTAPACIIPGVIPQGCK